MIYYVINHLEVDLFKSPQRLGDLPFSIDFDQHLMLTRPALGGRIQLDEQKRIISSNTIIQFPEHFPQNGELSLLKDDVPKAAVAFKNFPGAFGTRDSP